MTPKPKCSKCKKPMRYVENKSTELYIYALYWCGDCRRWYKRRIKPLDWHERILKQKAQ